MIPLSATGPYRLRVPIVSLSLIAINAAVFLYELALGSDRTLFVYKFGLIPDEITTGREFTRLVTRSGLLDITTPLPTWATLFTAMFLHGDLVHFGSNMLYLWVFGSNVEGRAGRIPFLAFYIAVGVVASAVQIAVSPHSQVPVIGASGAIAGVLGAYFLLFPSGRVQALLIYFVITVVRIPAVYMLGFWILLQFWEGLGSLGVSAQSGGVAYWAHIGGFAAGVLTIAIYRTLRRQPVWSGGQ